MKDACGTCTLSKVYIVMEPRQNSKHWNHTTNDNDAKKVCNVKNNVKLEPTEKTTVHVRQHESEDEDLGVH